MHSSNMKSRRSNPLIESTEIPYEIKVHLDTLETQEERPVMLSKWARETFKKGHKFERSNEEIADWVETYALRKDYTPRQIRAVLKQNGYVRHPEQDHSTGRIRGSTSANSYVTLFHSLNKDITGLDVDDMNKIHSVARVVEEVQPRLVEIAKKNTQSERGAMLLAVQHAIGLLQRLEQILLQEAKGMPRLEP